MNIPFLFPPVIEFVAGSGLDEESDVVLINNGILSILSRGSALDDGASTVTHVGRTLINDGGLVEVEPDAILQFQDGENTRKARVELQERAVLQIVGAGRTDEISYLLSEGEPRTTELGGFFNLRADGEFVLAAGSAIRLIGRGSAFPDAPSGLRTEIPLTVEHFKLGGPSGAQPRFAGAASLKGAALTITKSLEWHGGDFFGNGSNNQPGTQSIELPPGSAMVINSTSENPGSHCGLAAGAVFNFHGQATINTPFGLLLRGGSEFVHHSDAALLYTGDSLSTIVNVPGSAGAFISRGTIRKNGLGKVTFNDNFRQAGGDIIIEEGSLAAGTSQTSFSGQIRVNPSATFETLGGIFENTRVEGSVRLALGTEFRGTVQLGAVQVGANGALGDTLRSAPNTVINVARFFTWLGGNINMDPTGTINLAPGSVAVLRNENASGFFTFFKSGTINNEGETTYIADSASRIVGGGSGATWNNKPGGRFIIQGGGNVFQADLNEPLTFNNEGEVIRGAGADQNVLWHARTFNRGSGKFEIGTPGPNPPLVLKRISAAQFHAQGVPPLKEFRMTQNVLVQGGNMVFRDHLVTYAGDYEQSAGNVMFTGASRAVWRKTPKLAGGGVAFHEAGNGLFEKSSPLDGSAVLFLDEGARVEVLGGLTLAGESALEGRGEVIGDVTVNGGAINPGVHENLPPIFGKLRITGQCAFGPDGELIIDLPVNQAQPAADELSVSGQLTFGGKLTVVSSGSPVAINTPFIRVASFGSRSGEFTDFEGLFLGGGKRFDPEFRETGEFGLVLISGGDGADLELTALSGPKVGSAETVATYEFQVVNRGPLGANQIRLNINLPPGAEFIDSETAVVPSADRIGFNLATLNGGDTNLVTFRLRLPPAAGVIQLLGEITSQQADPFAANNTAQLTTVILATGDLRIGSLAVIENGLRLRVLVPTLPDVRYVLERSADLVTWLKSRRNRSRHRCGRVLSVGDSVNRGDCRLLKPEV